jgi:hypothetical protein
MRSLTLVMAALLSLACTSSNRSRLVVMDPAAADALRRHFAAYRTGQPFALRTGTCPMPVARGDSTSIPMPVAHRDSTIVLSMPIARVGCYNPLFEKK